MCHILIGADHDHAALFSVNAAHVKDIPHSFVIDAEDFFVVLESELACLGSQEGGHLLVGQLIKGLLEDGTKINHGIDVFTRLGVLDDGGIGVALQPIRQLVNGRSCA